MKLKRIYRFHKWSGLIAGALIFLLSLSGAILVFHQELDDLQYEKYLHVENDRSVSIDKAYDRIVASYSAWDIRLIRFSADPSETLVFQLRSPEDRLIAFVHPSSGELLKVVRQSSGVIFWILKFHYSLHAGLAGEIVVLIVGLLFVISLITGSVVYRRALLKCLLFKIRFNVRNRNSFYSSLHRYVGVWALLFNLIMAISGLVISYEIVSAGMNPPKPAALNSPVLNRVSVDKLLAGISTQLPEFHPSYIRFPSNVNDKITFSGTTDNRSRIFSRFYNSVTADIQTGKLSGVVSTKPLSSLVRGIHFVEYGNFIIKFLFVLVGLSGPVLSVSGFFLWRRRRKTAEIK
ncbi:MAG: PepSY-associated TM helix domain-containing protein [Daejeonella sp.]